MTMDRVIIDVSTDVCPIRSIQIQAGSEARERQARLAFGRALPACSWCLGLVEGNPRGRCPGAA